MIIVAFLGGLGNQMFQYALYRKMQCIGNLCKSDLSYYSKNVKHNGFELTKIFNINLDVATEDEMDKMKKIYPVGEGGNSIYFPQILECKQAYLVGYWQTEKYFRDIRSILLKEFTWDEGLTEHNQSICEEIQKSESVAIHVRRGDYLLIDQYKEIATLDYYKNAISCIQYKIKQPKFYIFSNDVEWVNEHMAIENSVIVDWNQGIESAKDMYLMSLCKHQIIANSTFSWWAAWLNQNISKIIIAPCKWLNGNICPDIAFDNWIRL